MAACRIYRLSIWELAKGHYDLAQRRAWSSWGDDPAHMREKLVQGQTLVAERNGDIAGFAQRHPGDYINMLYVAPAHARRGVALALLQALESSAQAEGITQLTCHASAVSRILFERAGYRIRQTEYTARLGQRLVRYHMEKVAAAATSEGISRR